MSKRNTTKQFIERAKEKHGERYDYSLVDYKRGKDKVEIICPTHGVFKQTAFDHLQGYGCSKCGVEKSSKTRSYATEDFIKLSKEVHGEKYNYSLTNYVSSKTNVVIICPTHGTFTQRPSHHLGGSGCKKCGKERNRKSTRIGKTGFITRADSVHSHKYDYSLVEYVNANTKVKIVCPEHGVFEQTPSGHLQGRGCFKCGIIKFSSSRTFTFEDFVCKARSVHNNRYIYDNVVYVTSQNKVNIICPEHGEFEQTANKHLQGQGCPKCVHQISKSEQEIFDFLNKHVPCKQVDRTLIKPLELDIFIPSLNIAVEYNGLYYHSDKFRDKDYHLDKLTLCQEKGIRLIQIFEDEWYSKQEICKSRLLNLLNFTPNKVFARKCDVREVSAKDAREFLEINHIQGNVNSKIKLGLYYNEELVSLMTFGNLRKNLGQVSKEGIYELLRFCNKLNTNVVGGASKLLSYFEKVYKPVEIISYADRRWSDGNLYRQIGFELTSTSQPNYFYTKGLERENRFKYRKSELVKQGFDPNKTEKQIMEELGYMRVYDCGTLKFVKNYKC